MGRENQDMMGMQWGCCANMILLILTVILFTSGVLVIIANYHCFLYCNNHRHVHCRCSFWLLLSMWSGWRNIHVTNSWSLLLHVITPIIAICIHFYLNNHLSLSSSCTCTCTNTIITILIIMTIIMIIGSSPNEDRTYRKMSETPRICYKYNRSCMCNPMDLHPLKKISQLPCRFPQTVDDPQKNVIPTHPTQVASGTLLFNRLGLRTLCIRSISKSAGAAPAAGIFWDN